MGEKKKMDVNKLEEGEYRVHPHEAWMPPSPFEMATHAEAVCEIIDGMRGVVDPHLLVAANEPTNVAMGRIFAAIGVMMNDSRMLAAKEGMEFNAAHMLAIGVFVAPILTSVFTREVEIATAHFDELAKLREFAN